MKVLLVNGSPNKNGCTNAALSIAGTTATIDQLNKYLLYAQMPVVSSRYWNMAHGKTPEEVMQDEEGVQIIRVLGKNMAWLLKSIDADRREGLREPEKEERIGTNYIR